MKRCPTCNRTYTDESLSFCLDDGTPLAVSTDAVGQQYDPQATLFMPNPPDIQTSVVQSRTTAGDTPTQPPQPNQPQTSVQGSNQQSPTIQSSLPGSPFQSPSSQTPFQSPTQEPISQQPPSWQTPIKHGPPVVERKKKRSVLPWVIGGIVLLVGGGLSLVIALAIIASMNDNDNANNENANVAINRNEKNSNGSKNVNNSNNTKNSNEYSNKNNNKTVTASDTVPTSSLVKYITEAYLSPNVKQGKAGTGFEKNDIIFMNFNVNGLPGKSAIKGIIEVEELYESSDEVKVGDKVEASETFERDKKYNGHFRFTPGPAGWPKGSYKAGLYEVADDKTLSLIVPFKFLIE